jgi:hypothetical protein
MGGTTSLLKQEEKLTRTDLPQVNGHKILLLGIQIRLLGFPGNFLTPVLFTAGCSDSGKSTIRKQVKINYQKGYSLFERLDVRSTIYLNFLESAEAVALVMRNLESGKDARFRNSVEKILTCSTRMRNEGWLNVEVNADETAAARAAWRSHPERAAWPSWIAYNSISMYVQTLSGRLAHKEMLNKDANGGIERELLRELLREVALEIHPLMRDPTFQDVIEQRIGGVKIMESDV